MARGRTRTMLTRRMDGGEVSRVPDELIVEEPLTIQLDGHVVATTMRTPGHDFELAAGLCFTDGLLAGAPVKRVRYCGDAPAVDTHFNVVTVETGGAAPVPDARVGTTSSSCGWCGSWAVDDLTGRLGRVDAPPIETGVLVGLRSEVAARQELFRRTGAVHAAAAFTRAGEVVLVREDIGRHNAVDKLVGRLLLDGRLPARELGLWVSGRASFEIVAKAWAAGFGTVVAVSAPSALAVETARSAGIHLAGFVRGDRLNLYSPDDQA